MNLEELLQEAKNGNMVAQYDLAMYYGKLLKETEDEDEIYRYSLDAMLWLKKSAQQGYGPAMEAVSELDLRPKDSGEATERPPVVFPVPEEAQAGPAEAEAPEGTEVPSEPAETEAPAIPEEPVFTDAFSELEEREEPKPDLDEETAAAVAAAVLESTLEMSDPVGDRAPDPDDPSRARSGDSFRPGGYEEPVRKKLFSSTANMVICCMLAVSLLLNVLLLIFLFRLSREKNTVPPAPVASVSPTPALETTPTSRPTPTPTAAPSPTPTAEPTEEPTPTEEPFWLDLSKYPKLELKPSEDQVYDDYVYYIVTADDTLNMRAGPDTRYERITTIPAMAKVGAVSKYGSWYLVEYQNEMGWVSGEYLTSNLNYQRPVSTPAPTPTPAPASSGDLTPFD